VPRCGAGAASGGGPARGLGTPYLSNQPGSSCCPGLGSLDELPPCCEQEPVTNEAIESLKSFTEPYL
jgi:hypothetical protein